MADHVDALTPAGVSELATFIIRPPRAQYSRADLGERSFFVESTRASRDDLTLLNPRGHQLHCSHFRPHNTTRPPPTLVYLHGNGSCRVDATVLLPLTIPYGIALFAFDFSGSGRSDGEFISLGVWERFDVETVVSHLVQQGVQDILLWGHSMGAATALMYAGLCARVPTVKGMVLDSPFASFDKLAQSLVADMALPRGLPRKLVLSVGVRAVRKLVRERAGFDVNEIDPLSATKNINANLPALFMHGTDDAVVPFAHGEMLYDQYPAPVKRWLPLPHLEHDTPRPESAMDQAFVFMQRHLRVPTSLDFFEAIKSRGNVAMLSSRYADAIYLYTQALDVLTESLKKTVGPSHPAARSRRHHPRPMLNHGSPDGLVRRNSSFPNILSSVKRWRQRPTMPASASPSAHQTDDEDDAAVPFRPPRPHRLYFDRNRRASTDVPGVSRRTSVEQAGGDPMASVGSAPAAETPGSVDSKALSPLADDESRSENSGHSGRFTPKQSWRARRVMENIKKRVRGAEPIEPTLQIPTPSTSTPPPPVTDGRSQSAHVVPSEYANGSTIVTEEESRRSSRSSRSSSRVRLRHRARRERVRRFRETDRQSRNQNGVDVNSLLRDVDPMASSTDCGAGENGDLGTEPGCGGGCGGGMLSGKWFSSGTESRLWPGLSSRDSSGLRSRFSASSLKRGASRLSSRGMGMSGGRANREMSGDTGESMRKDMVSGFAANGILRAVGLNNVAERKRTTDSDLRRTGTGDVREWVLDSGQRTVALALLGNRSLARRKVNDIQGALADATRCLQLDPTWVRGYLRRAAALREDGGLVEARKAVMAGLEHEPHHAGLIDMLHSIEKAMAETEGLEHAAAVNGNGTMEGS